MMPASRTTSSAMRPMGRALSSHAWPASIACSASFTMRSMTSALSSLLGANSSDVETMLARLRTSAVTTRRSEEHTSELHSLMRISYAVFCLNKNTATSSLHAMELSSQIINIHYL